MIKRLRNILSGPEPDDLVPGDFVRRVGFKGAGLVESVKDDHAVIAWSKDRRDILPLSVLRRVKQRGSSFDRMKL